MSDQTVSAELVILGAGPGGYPAAFLAADMGMDAVLIDPDENPGGVCLYRGCIPSKALLHAAKVIRQAREASAFGVHFGEPTVDLDQVRTFAAGAVASLTGGLGQLLRARKVRHIRARGVLQDAHTLLLQPVGNGPTRITFEHLILAVGSSPNRLPHAPLSANIWDSDRALLLPKIPKKLLVIGGGYIGLEIGTVYAALGSAVSVAEMTGTLLPGVDSDLVRPLRKRLGSLFSAIMLETGASSFEAQENGLEVILESVGKASAPRREQFDCCLVAVGRHPNTSDVGLENAGISIDEKGFVVVDKAMKTNVPNIYAIGDIAGPPMLAHTATHQGRIAVEAIHGRDVVFAPEAFPAVVFTDPEIAWCGLTEKEAGEKSRNVRVLKFPHNASGRAKTMHQSDGLTKLIVDTETGQILGAGIAGPDAGELIAEVVLAIEMGATAADLALTVHPHPTLSETLMEAAESFAGRSTHYMGEGPGRKGYR